MVGTMESGTRIGEPARRQHGRSFKASLVEQSSQPGASVAVIARNNGINANLLFKWRPAHGRKTTATSLSTAAAAAPTVLLPVHVEPVTRVGARSALEPTGRTHRQGVPEVGIEPSRHPDRSRIWAGVPDVRAAMGRTPRSSSMVENLNSRLRRYFFLRRHLGNAYLSLLQFFLNHRVLMRSRRAERVGKTPKQLLTGQPHAHWLELLGFEHLAPA